MRSTEKIEALIFLSRVECETFNGTNWYWLITESEITTVLYNVLAVALAGPITYGRHKKIIDGVWPDHVMR